jgi:hypothetical protein
LLGVADAAVNHPFHSARSAALLVGSTPCSSRTLQSSSLLRLQGKGHHPAMGRAFGDS